VPNSNTDIGGNKGRVLVDDDDSPSPAAANLEDFAIVLEPADEKRRPSKQEACYLGSAHAVFHWIN
jgi:hypothetical protein